MKIKLGVSRCADGPGCPEWRAGEVKPAAFCSPLIAAKIFVVTEAAAASGCGTKGSLCALAPWREGIEAILASRDGATGIDAARVGGSVMPGPPG